MKKKKYLLWGGTVLALTVSLTGVFAYTGQEKARGIKEVPILSDKPIYENLDQLKERAELVVIAEATPEKENFVIYDDGGVSAFATKRTITIEKILEDNTKGKVEVGDEIIVNEPNAIVEKGNRKSHYVREGYQLMEDGKKYLLFIRPGYVYDKEWIFLGVNQGKYELPTEDYEKKSMKSSSARTDDKLKGHGEFTEHYEDIQKEIIEEYSKELSEYSKEL